MNILQDTNFEKGLCAGWHYGENYSDSSQLRKGDVLTFRDVSPYKIFLIPYGTVNEGYNEKDMYWELEEGFHNDYVDQYGKHVQELHEFRLSINNYIKENTPDSLIVEQFNNYGITRDAPEFNKTLIKQISTNKKGTINFYYNTKNDIRNAAYAYDAKFSYDTWCHLYFHQNLKKDIDISEFKRIDVNFNILVKKINQIDKWPDDDTSIIGEKSPSEMSLQGFFFCRLKSKPTNGFFVGLNIWSTRDENQQMLCSADQFGTAFYRISPLKYGGKVSLNNKCQISFELIGMMEDALKEINKMSSPLKDTKSNDYQISFFQIGWEGIGHWECEYQLSKLSAVGHEK